MFKLNEDLFEDDELEILEDEFVHPGVAFVDNFGKKWVFDQEFADAYDYYIWSAIDEEGNTNYFVVDQNFYVDGPEDVFYKISAGPLKTYEEAQEKFGAIVDKLEDEEEMYLDDVDTVVDKLSKGEYDESLDEAFDVKENLSDIELVDRLNFKNRRSSLPGINNMKEFISALEEVGKNKFKVRSNKTGFSESDMKDSWMAINRKGWSIYKAWDSSLDGFNEVYVFEKRGFKEALSNYQVEFNVNGKKTADTVSAENDKEAEKLIKDKYKGSLVTITNKQEIKEDFDETISDETPEPGLDTGAAGLLIQAINDEWRTIDFYNNIISTLSEEHQNDLCESIIDIVKDITAEENNHVGMLQKALALISPNIENIKAGEEEAQEKIDEVQNENN